MIVDMLGVRGKQGLNWKLEISKFTMYFIPTPYPLFLRLSSRGYGDRQQLTSYALPQGSFPRVDTRMYPLRWPSHLK